MKKIIVTGATGLIGSHLLEPLASMFEVHAISRLQTNKEIENVKWHQADLSGGFDTSILPTNVESVIYLAQSENFRDFPDKALDVFEVNTVKLFKMLDYARVAEAKKFIYASSGGVYGVGENAFSEDVTLPANSENGFYLSTKLCSEILAENYKPFMNIVILRFFFVYGKGQKRSMLIPRLADNIQEGNPISLQGNEGIFLNPIHVSDAVSSVLAALELKGLHKINVAGPEVLSLKRISEIIGDKVGVQPIFRYDTTNMPRHLIGNIVNMKKLLTTPLCFPLDGFNDAIDIKIRKRE
jgi:nucleoside-diphosphate-sugar epimerase